MEVVLQIHHLDDTDESDEVISILQRIGLKEGWKIYKPTEETNSILIRYNRDRKLEPAEYVERDLLLNNAAEFLMPFEKKQIDEVKEFQLGVMLKIVTDEFALPVPAKLLAECGRLGIDLYILYTGR